MSTTPALLVSDPNRSPFNLSAPIVLSDLDAAQVQEISRRYGLPWGAQEIEGVMRVYKLYLPPRAAYVLGGPARSVWEHRIPPVKELRYSLTFRSLRRRP